MHNGNVPLILATYSNRNNDCHFTAATNIKAVEILVPTCVSERNIPVMNCMKRVLIDVGFFYALSKENVWPNKDLHSFLFIRTIT